MADSAIKAAGGEDAPLHYRVPGAAVIRIKQVHVHYTDNGASGDWLPMVRIVSDSGHTMGQAADQAVKVTVGNDAAVTFLPGVKHAPASSAASLPLYGVLALSVVAFGDTAFTVPGTGANVNVLFPHQNGGYAPVFQFQPSTPYSDTIQLNSTDYLYVVTASVEWPAPGFNQQTVILGPTLALDGNFLWGDLLGHGETPANTFKTDGPFGIGGWSTWDQKPFICDTVPQTVTLNLLQDSGVDKTITRATMVCVAYKVF